MKGLFVPILLVLGGVVAVGASLQTKKIESKPTVQPVPVQTVSHVPVSDNKELERLRADYAKAKSELAKTEQALQATQDSLAYMVKKEKAAENCKCTSDKDPACTCATCNCAVKNVIASAADTPPKILDTTTIPVNPVTVPVKPAQPVAAVVYSAGSCANGSCRAVSEGGWGSGGYQTYSRPRLFRRR